MRKKLLIAFLVPVGIWVGLIGGQLLGKLVVYVLSSVGLLDNFYRFLDAIMFVK